MGNNISSTDIQSTQKRSVNKYSRGRRLSLISNNSSRSLKNQIKSQENTITIKSTKRPLIYTQTNPSILSPLENDPLPTLNESQENEITTEIDTVPDIQNSSSIHNKRIKSQRYSRTAKILVPRDRYSSILSVSGFSTSNFTDPLHFSVVADSTITDLTNLSGFSDHSFLEKSEDNQYIMHLPTDTPSSLPSIENVTTSDDILQLLSHHPQNTHDLLTALYGSEQIKQVELQREAFQAIETWSLRPTDASAKTFVACCRLCGWGTTRNPKRGFQELESLAKAGAWEAYYYLGQCYHYGVEQSTEQKISPQYDLAIYWYQKLIESDPSQSDRLSFYIAEAQFRVAVIYFTTGQLTPEKVEESIDYLKKSAAVGNRKSEFSLGFLVEAGVIQDDTNAKEFYSLSAKKSFTPAQIQLALILLKEGSSEGMAWLHHAARLGDPRAFYYLGESYEFGRGTTADPQKAVEYYQKAADLDYAQSEFRLGMHYLYGGLRLTANPTKAFDYMTRAANRNNPQAQYLLGIMYRDGKGTTRNKKEGFYWIRKAASQRLPSALTQIASCYEEGVGTAVNHALATEYYEMATRIPGKHVASAQQTYASFLHKNGKYQKALEMYQLAAGIVSSRLNTYPPSPLIARTSKRMVAIFYLDKNDLSTPYKPQEAFEILSSLASAPEGDPEAHYWIAVCYEEGVPDVIEKDLEKAYHHYLISANLGLSDSQFQIGNMLCKGLGVKEDRTKAFEWFQKAAEKKNAKALYYIGIYYYNGSGTIPRDHNKALIYFKLSAELKNIDAMVSYAQLCQERLKTPHLSLHQKETYQTDMMKWYSKAARLNNVTALRELGRLYGSNGDFTAAAECFLKASALNDAHSTLFLGGYYEKGQGVTANKDTALQYYLKAIELGHPTALFAIAELYENLKNYEEAYNYYTRVLNDSRIPKSYQSSKTSRLKVALYSLNYDPNTFLYNQIPINQPKSLQSIKNLLPKAEAFKILMDLATQEDMSETYNWIAECYQDGKGTTKDLSKSLQWRIKASEEAGDVNAMMRLAYMYENGINGVPKDTLNASKLYKHTC